MHFKLVTEWPAWWLIFCVAAGLLYAWILYGRETALESYSKWFRRGLFAFRTLAVTLLAFLLLGPFIRTFSRETEKPLLIIAQDNSQSIVINKDSAFYRNEYPQLLRKFADGLSDKYDVKILDWGDRVSEQGAPTFTDRQTDFSDLFQDAETRFGHLNTGALVIASDGLYNRGSNPLYESDKLHLPVYTIALGDTITRKDLLISKVNFNKIVYLGNAFPVEVTVNARQCSGEKSVLTISSDTAVLFSKQLSFAGNVSSQVVPVVLDATRKGMLHLKIKVAPLSGEVTEANNEKDIFLEVLESKQKIYLVADAPHPDVAAFRQSIESGQNFSVKVAMAGKATENPEGYNLLVLHNLPSASHGAGDLVKKAMAAGVPILYILGTQTDLNNFNALQSGLTITAGLNKSNAVQAVANPDFSLFQLDEDTRRMIPQFPPLLAPFGKYTSTTNNYFLLTQKVGNINTNEPLLLFNESGPARIGVLCGEGIWRWRLSDFEANGNFNAVNEILLKTVQNLAVRDNRSHFRVLTKNNLNENEAVSFSAELYDDNYELINSPDVNLTISASGGKSYPYTFSKGDRTYNLNAGFLSPGDYKYKASARLGDKVYAAEGEFSVNALQVEQTETVANHQLLYNLAIKNGGKMYYPSQLDALKKELLDRDDIRPVSYSHYKLRDLVHLKWVFFVLLALLSLEWFLRKRAGAY